MNTSPVTTTLFRGEDSEIILDLGDTEFGDLADVIVGVRVNDTLVKTLKKTNAAGPTQVVSADLDTQCIVRLFRSETRSWAIPNPPNVAKLILEVTLVHTDAAFPQGRHETQVIYLCNFSPALTAV